MRSIKFLIASGLLYGSLVLINRPPTNPVVDPRIETEKFRENFRSSMINVPYIEVRGEFVYLEKDSEFYIAK